MMVLVSIYQLLCGNRYLAQETFQSLESRLTQWLSSLMGEYGHAPLKNGSFRSNFGLLIWIFVEQ